MSVRLFYDRWPQYNRRLKDIVVALSDDELALRPAPDQWPIWAIVGHVAGTRVYWLCRVLREPGIENTPFAELPEGEGWEDDLTRPRPAADLVAALDTTFSIIDGVLDRWTPDMLGEEFERWFRDERQFHSRTSVLQRLLTHEAYHGGELSQTLGRNDLEPVYIWRSY